MKALVKKYAEEGLWLEDMPEPEMDINEPAAAGPEEEPLGRAPVEL